MVDLWGPGAFGAADAAAARPAYTPLDGAGDPDTFYKDCSSPAEDDGTEWKAAPLNMLLAQLRAVVRGGSVPATNLRDTLLLESILSGKASHAFATGTANAWTVTPSLAVPAYGGGRVLNVVAPGTNTSTTVNMNVSTLGNRRIKKMDGSDPAIGDLVSGVAYPTFDDGTNIRILTVLPSDITNPGGISALRYLGSTYLSTAGSSTVTPPAGAKSANVELWGGGGGSSDSGASQSISGGGGGEYRRGTIAVTAGTPVSYTIGTGGARTTYGATAGSGGSTTIGGITAAGGGGSNSSSVGGGGAGGTGGTLAITGQSGNPYALPTGTGGAGGVAGRGGPGGSSGAAGAGSPGIQPGGGGGGPGSGGNLGQAGAPGAILIDWYG